MDAASFSAPFRVVEERVMDEYRRAFDRLFADPGRSPHAPYQARRLDAPVVLDLCRHPLLLARVHAQLGPAVVLWRTNFYRKDAGDGALGWHRDRDHWEGLLDPMQCVSAWIAIDGATRESGCLEFRGSDDAPVPVELAPGECVLFDQDTWHRSRPNASTARRLGLAVRFTPPNVRIRATRHQGRSETILLEER